MSKFTSALALAKPIDATKLPEDVYSVRVVSARMDKPGIVRLDLETLAGKTTGTKFAGRRQIKNQPLSEAAAGYVCALLTTLGLADIITNAALAEALEAGDEAQLRRFVGGTLTVARSYSKDSDDVRMDIVVEQ